MTQYSTAETNMSKLVQVSQIYSMDKRKHCYFFFFFRATGQMWHPWIINPPPSNHECATCYGAIIEMTMKQGIGENCLRKEGQKLDKLKWTGIDSE